jgi:hypothetical protein
MRTAPRRRRGLLWAALAACAATTAALALHALAPTPFPDQLPNSHSDVSLQQALRDHGIILPRSTRNLRYSANRDTEDDDYPLAADFTLACPDIPVLSAANNLDQVSHPYLLLDSGVYDLAGNLGANPDAPTATWYEHVDGTQATLSVMIQPASGNCTACLFAHRYPA